MTEHSKEVDKIFSQLMSHYEGADRQDSTLLLDAICQRVDQLLNSSPELLFSYLYRLDILEGPLKKALRSSDPILSISRLIYQRQIQRIESKKKHKSNPIKGWEW